MRAGSLDEIQTEYIRNTRLEAYRYTNLLKNYPGIRWTEENIAKNSGRMAS
jgi:hypothetical protein